MPRARKVGLKRIDAALDALRPMGFPDSLVRRTVRNLLKEYGGDEGWTFIEEFSYKIVIESMLEEQGEEKNGPRLSGNTEPTLLLGNGVAGDKMTEDKARTKVQSSSSQRPPAKKQALQVDFPKNSSSHALPCSLKETSQVELEKQFPSSKMSEVGSSELFSSPAVESRPRRRRRPYYGWISSDEE